MKVCLFTINAKDFHSPPFGMWVLKAYLDHYCSAHDVDVSVLSFPFETSIQTVVDTIEELQADLVGASHYIWNDEAMVQVFPLLKESLGENGMLIVGGPHADVEDSRLMSFLNTGVLDAMVIGEGEEPLLHIVTCMAEKKELTPVGGLVFSQGKEISPYFPQILPRGAIDYLPNPYQAVPELMSLSLAAGHIQYETSRGCPFSCTFCDQGHKAYRSLSMERIKADLAYFAQYKPQHIDFLDGTFNLHPTRTVELLTYLIDLNAGWTFHAEIKPDHLTREEVQLLAKAKCKTVELGLQSIHSQTLTVIKRRYRKEAFEQSVQNLLGAGIGVVINTIIGLPGETLSDWYESLDYCFQLGRVMVLSNVLKILPNTELVNQIEEYGFQYKRDNFNVVTSTHTFPVLDMQKAQAVNKLVSLFWNDVNMPSSVRSIVDLVFNGKFHCLLEAICDLLLDHPALIAQSNYHVAILDHILDESGLAGQQKEQLREQIASDFGKVGIVS